MPFSRGFPLIDRQVVAHVAKLARIAVPADELDTLSSQLAAIVGYVEQIQKLDLAEVPPLSHGGDARNVFRPDESRPPLPKEAALANAPDRQGDFFRVPRVIAEP
jgi:aspartyl-tRNA(Asn)/glutamyl-tRNA(Gln) amidotransferase subunit C